MPAIMPTHLLTLGECKTPDEFKEKVHELLDPALATYKVCNTDVLFVTYIEPGKTAGGILKSDRSQQEILFQGSIGLVVGMGPLAFKYDSKGYKWEGDPAHIDDWIVVRFADCWEIHIEGVSCRLIDPENIRGIVKDPTIITSRPASISRPLHTPLTRHLLGSTAAGGVPLIGGGNG